MSASVEIVAAMAVPSPSVCRCTHPETDHCEGNKPHSGWRGKGGLELCVSRHCEQPLCSCIAFQKKAGGAQ